MYFPAKRHILLKCLFLGVKNPISALLMSNNYQYPTYLMSTHANINTQFLAIMIRYMYHATFHLLNYS